MNILLPRRFAPALLVFAWALPAVAQEPVPAPQPPQVSAPAAAPAANAVAATVNGQAIPEVAVARGLRRVPADDHAKARPEILDFLIENILIDQYLAKQGITVTDKEAADRLVVIQEEVKKSGQDYAKMLQSLMISEEELKEQLKADLRWEKFAATQATEAALRELFQKSPEVFDGSLVRAKHILLPAALNDAAAQAKAKEQIAQFKQQVEAAVQAGLAKLPPTTDALAREQERQRLTDIAFGALAREKSSCPSKKDDGDINWFPRAGSMVEPFAAVAFALPPFQMSDAVVTPFGVHLILVTGRRPGRPTKFEDVKEEVKEVFCSRLRETLAAQLRSGAQIVVTPAKP